MNGSLNLSLPFQLKIDVSGEEEGLHWHADPEVLLCTGGHGCVILNGKKIHFIRNDVIAVTPGMIHYVPAAGEPQYTALRFSIEYCRAVGIDPADLSFTPFIINSAFSNMLVQLREFWVNPNVPYGRVKAQELALKILAELAERYGKEQITLSRRSLERVKAAISFLESHYAEKISLEQAAKALSMDKYALCRDFKQLTGQSAVEFLNRVRCRRAAEYLKEGKTVAQAAALCGFRNRSYFAKTYLKYQGELPSACKIKKSGCKAAGKNI